MQSSFIVLYGYMYVNFMYSKVTDELLKLQKEQEELQSKLKLRVIGMPLFRTVLEVRMWTLKIQYLHVRMLLILHQKMSLRFQCIKNRQMKAAEQLRKDFKMSDNQYVLSSWIRVHVFTYVPGCICVVLVYIDIGGPRFKD